MTCRSPRPEASRGSLRSFGTHGSHLAVGDGAKGAMAAGPKPDKTFKPIRIEMKMC